MRGGLLNISSEINPLLIDERMAYRNKASGEAINEAINDALNEDEKSIVEIIRIEPSVSQKVLSDKTGFSRSKVQRIMKKLINNQVIYHDGAKKNGIWRVIGK